MTVVVGYTPSGQGIAALAAAVRQARRTGKHLVVASHLYNDPDAGPTAADEDAVRSALTDLDAADVPATVRTCTGSDIGESLLEAAREAEAELLVIGLRRKSPIGKLNLGASARKVFLLAPCPVLAVKDEHVTPGAAHHARV
jgi:nucleotide-binding universal stress UspA family protein